jgi:UDP-N-acetyl-D-galactosamine dehydrogenase
MLDRTRTPQFAYAKTRASSAPLQINLDEAVIGLIGLGYVGLPLAVEFGKTRAVVGFDIRVERIEELRRGNDSTLEVTKDILASAKKLHYTSDLNDLKRSKIFIVTVPTPIDQARRPDLEPLRKASEIVGATLSPGSIVIYESTVYPGCTEEFCVPILERVSGLTYNKEFFVGYSPERINPGDPTHRLANITKVTSGSTPGVAEAIDSLYAQIIKAGTHKASSIRVAEAAKVIENTQRDVNIALMNELSLIFHRLEIDTHEVLEVAETKWNFLPFRPGLVGGHCIGVDPYYLTHKAQEIGYHPEVILAGRRINDGMGKFVADEVIKLMLKKAMPIAGSRVLVLGLAFKENCPDVRNSKVIDVISTLKQYHLHVDVHDPWIDGHAVAHELGLNCLDNIPEPGQYDAIVVAVAHQQFREAGVEEIRKVGKPGVVIYDVKGIFPRSEVDGRL